MEGTIIHFTTLPVEGIPQPEPEEIDKVYKEFQVDPLPGKILYAFYDIEEYTGYSYVLYRDEDGELWEVEGSHCSCNGLEGQWSPGKATVEYLLLRAEGVKKSRWFGDFSHIAPDVLKVAQYLDSTKTTHCPHGYALDYRCPQCHEEDGP